MQLDLVSSEACYFISNKQIFMGSGLFLEMEDFCLETEALSSSWVKER